MLGRGAGGALDSNTRQMAATSIPSMVRIRCSSIPSAPCVRWLWAICWGTCCMGENDRTISLLDRLLQHARSTARYSVYYGEGRDVYDVRGRTAHECMFNTKDGNYRCPNSQQGYSPFTTWTRGLAWAMCGFAEELEYLRDAYRCRSGAATAGALRWSPWMRKAAEAACDFYIDDGTALDGIPYWDTGAPNLHKTGRLAVPRRRPVQRV